VRLGKPGLSGSSVNLPRFHICHVGLGGGGAQLLIVGFLLILNGSAVLIDSQWFCRSNHSGLQPDPRPATDKSIEP
jgi:hypothetical protein